MRAISLWQPWASAVALGSKTIETRSWATKYRGPLVIHAAQRCVKRELFSFQQNAGWRAALHYHQHALGCKAGRDLADVLPFGELVAVCDLVDCRPSESFKCVELDEPRTSSWLGKSGIWSERDMGDFLPGRFGWVLENIRPFGEMMPWKGKQGFFQVPDSLIADAIVF